MGTPVTGVPLPAARSADIGRVIDVEPTDDPNRPLLPHEIEELNRAALASGLVRGPVNPGIAATLQSGEDTGNYASLEEAIAAGAPVGADAEMVATGAARFRDLAPIFQPAPVATHAPRNVVRHQTAREFIASQGVAQIPRLPDFKKVQMIDLQNGRFYVDGLEFEIDAESLKMLRKFCVVHARTQIQRSLDDAMKALEEAASEGGAETV